MANVTDKVALIRGAIFGKDVRESLATGIEAINTEVVSTTGKQGVLETIFNDLVINAGSSNAEVVSARGGEVSLPVRLNNVDSSLATNTQQVATNTTQITSLASGSPKGIYTTVPNLQTAFPTGNTNIYLVLGNVAEVASLDITASPTSMGNVTVTLDGVGKTVAVTPGVAEVASLSISAIPTVASNVTVTLNGVATNIAVDPVTDTTTDAIATKIRNTTFTGWTTGGTGATVTFTATITGIKTDATYSAGTTGATGTMSTTTQGVNADTTSTVATKIRGTSFTGWTTGGTDTNITFTATTTGVRTDATYSAGTTGSTGTMSTTTQGVNPDGNWYYWNGTIWVAGGVYQSTGIANGSVGIIATDTYISDKVEKGYATTESDYKLGITAIDGAATSTPKTIIDLNSPAKFDGLLKSVQIYVKTIGNIKVKVVSFVSGTNYNVEATSADIVLSSTGLATLLNGTHFNNLNIKAGQYIAFYASNGTIISTSDAIGNKIAYATGDVVNGFNVTGAYAYKLNFNYSVQGGGWKEFLDGYLSATKYLSPYDSDLFGSLIMDGTISSLDKIYMNKLPNTYQDGYLSKVNVYIKTIGTIQLKVMSLISGENYNVESTSPDITITNTGALTLLDGTHFNNILLKKGQYLGIYMRNGAQIAYNSSTTDSVSIFSATFIGSITGTNYASVASYNYSLKGASWKQNIDNFIATTNDFIAVVPSTYATKDTTFPFGSNKLFSTKFPSTTLPSGMVKKGTWDINNSLTTVDSTTLAWDYVIWDKYSTVDRAKIRTRVKIEAQGKFALIRKPPVDVNKMGTVCEIDTVNKKINLYAQYANVTPITTIIASYDIPFDFVLNREYICILEKNTGFNIISISDTVTQQKCSFSFDNQLVSYGTNVGKQWGAPGVMYMGVGRFRFLSLDFIADFAKTTKCVIMGDSITEGFALNDISQPLSVRWCAKVQADLLNKCVISGAGGQRSDDLVARLPIDFETYVSEYLVALIGTNDLGQETGIEPWKVNIQAIISSALSKGSIPVLCALPPMVGCAPFNAYLRSLGYTVVGFDYALSTGNDGITVNNSLFIDGIHPNVEGNEKMYQQVLIDAGFLFD